MIQIKKKHLLVFLVLNVFLVIVISIGINYAYSKFLWSNRVSLHSGANSIDYEGPDTPDTLIQAYIGQAYKIGTAFEVYKPKDPLLKVVSENHGAIEMAVASGDEHFSDLAKTRDAVIRKVGEGNLIFSIPSYTDENDRSIIFGNESKILVEINNFDEILIDTKNLSLNNSGQLRVNDIYLNEMDHKASISAYLNNLNTSVIRTMARLEALENKN